MKRTLILIAAVAITATLTACTVNYDKTPSGLVYKIFPADKAGAKPVAGDFVKFNLKYIISRDGKDSVLTNTFEGLPQYFQLDTSKRSEYSFMEIIPRMGAGDSAEVNISVDTLKSRNMIPDYNPILTKGSTIKCYVKLIGTYKKEEDMMADYNTEMDRFKADEIKDIEAYMAKNNMKGTKTKSGAYVVIEQPGDASVKADSGKMASIMYKGYLMTDGKVFDTNMDSSKGHTDPIEVAVGQHRVIQGWDEALPYFGKGAKGKILVPAMLGYGPQAQGTDIPAFSNLVFDIEVLDVKDAPAGPQMPQMPQQQQQK